MLKRTVQVLFPGILFGLLGLYYIATPPGRGAASNLKDLPLLLAGLPGEDIPPSQIVMDELSPDDILLRRYIRPDGVPIWLVIVYFVNSRRAGHDPQICYYSQGYHTREAPPVHAASAIGDVVAESFVASRAGRDERVLTFWYAPGGRILPDVRRYRRTLFLHGILENRSYGAFVRISTLETDHRGTAEEWNKRFLGEVAGQLPRLIRG